jgi:ATP-dependent exoDNAse (exonuclease V) beta subunit
VTADALQAALGQVWVAAGYADEAQEAEHRDEAARILGEYHAAAEAVRRQAPPDAPPPPRLLFSEKTLRMDLSPEVALSGRVDRVDEHHDGTLEIVDYKSGRTHVDPDDVRHSLALGIYQVLLKHRFPDRRVFATLHALRSGASASYELDETERKNWPAVALFGPTRSAPRIGKPCSPW